MRAAGGYLQEAAPVVPAGAPDAVAPPTASVPVVFAAATLHAPSDEAPVVETMSRRALRAAAPVSAPRPPRDHAGRGARSGRPERAPQDPDAAAHSKTIRQRVSAAGVMVLVGGLFASLTLPAYADNGAGAVAAIAAKGGTQALAVDSKADTQSESRDNYTATSAADLKSLYASALRQTNLQAYLASGARALGDDYPWPDQLSRNQGGGISPLGYYYRECVDFVSWRLNRDAGAGPAGPFIFTTSWGNASSWKSAWLNNGWATGTEPKVGAVAYFPGQNHVAYVAGLTPDGQVAIEEYNWGGMHEYHQRVIAPGDAYYLYAPPH